MQCLSCFCFCCRPALKNGTAGKEPSAMMQEKWTLAFKLLDFNKDGVISSLDRDDCKKSFSSMYQVTGQQADTMLAELDAFWSKAVFLKEPVDWTKSFTPNDVLQTRQKAFEADQAGTMEVVREAMVHLVRAADVNGTKKFNFEEFRRLHEAFNLKNDGLVQNIFSMTEPQQGYCSSDAIIDFYTELTMGSDTSKHEQYKAGLAAVGFL